MNTTCLTLELGVPKVAGTTEEPPGAPAAVMPLLASTTALMRARSAHDARKSMDCTVPLSRLPMYEGLLPLWFPVVGSISTPLAPAPKPLALVTQRRAPSPLTATADGYQPVGSRP